MIFRARSTNDEWQTLSAELVAQVNTLGTTLVRGGVGTIRVSKSGADELVLRPAYCNRDTLTAHFPDRPSAFINEFPAPSGGDRLVWMRGGRTLSINPAKFTVGMNVTLVSWALNGVREIKVVKESQSPNGFLSLNLLEDSEGNQR